MDIEKAIKNLKDRGFAVSRFESKEAAAEYLLSSISGTTVGIGGSGTVAALDIYERLRENNEVYWHLMDGLKPETAKQASSARVYLSSANAIAETGEIVNIDGRGNRVAATLYDKDKVYIIVGTNKFTDDFDSAVWRARNIASPKNAKRLGVKTPCAVKADRCYDCRSPQRICNGLVVIWGKMLAVGELEVVIIDEELGY